ncbi:MAG: DUF4276 family protein [Pseudomonadota bacterium]
MSVERVDFLVEEPSMEAALRLLLPKILNDMPFEIYPYQCKDELLKRLTERLRGYARWLPQNWRIVVLVDRDDDDCLELKAKLEECAQSAGLPTRTRARTEVSPYIVTNRIVIEELEAWYFGDWEAVRAAYPNVPPTIPAQTQYRDPDAIKGGTWEAFERILRRKGHFLGGLRKIDVARSIVTHMDPKRNRSRSFQVFCEALQEMVSS